MFSQKSNKDVNTNRIGRSIRKKFDKRRERKRQVSNEWNSQQRDNLAKIIIISSVTNYIVVLTQLHPTLWALKVWLFRGEELFYWGIYLGNEINVPSYYQHTSNVPLLESFIVLKLYWRLSHNNELNTDAPCCCCISSMWNYS